MPNGESVSPHTRILRLTLAAIESRAYWEMVQPSLTVAERVERAFSERWFGNKSFARVKLLLSNFACRFDEYPEALETLRRWRPNERGTRALVCHWHLQLSDPLYRRFTGAWLPARLNDGGRRFDTDTVARWLVEVGHTSLAPSTRYQYASKLVRAADEAGLISPSKDGPRTALTPRVPDEALGYLVRLLQVVRHEGSWRDNAYFRSVGLTPDLIEARLRRLPDVTYRRMGELVELTASPIEALA